MESKWSTLLSSSVLALGAVTLSLFLFLFAYPLSFLVLAVLAIGALGAMLWHLTPRAKATHSQGAASPLQILEAQRQFSHRLIFQKPAHFFPHEIERGMRNRLARKVNVRRHWGHLRKLHTQNH